MISYFLFSSFVSIIEHEKYKGNEKRDRLLISEVSFSFQISEQYKNLLIDPLVSNWVSFINRVSIKIVHKIQRALRP